MDRDDAAIEPDTKDWTWVLTAPCPDCGYDAATVAAGDLAGRIRRNAEAWVTILTDRADASVRPTPAVWSPLEYACHVRDVHRVFAERVRLMLETDDPHFANWDQDTTAVEQAYGRQEPGSVANELVAAASSVADRYARVPDNNWSRRGFRSDGATFTVESLGRYHLHDAEHHLFDVAGDRQT